MSGLALVRAAESDAMVNLALGRPVAVKSSAKPAIPVKGMFEHAADMNRE